MAIYHLSAQIIGKAGGRSAVAAAAYRHCAKMSRDETGEEIDYSRKAGNAHSEFALPADAPDWIAKFAGGHSVEETSAYFWNAVEANEKRHDAQLAREIVLALPVELTVEQNIELIRDFVSLELAGRGIVADWAYHDMPGNPHVHIMTTLRPLTDTGFGPKRVAIVGEDGKPLRDKDGKIRYEQFSGGLERLRDMRKSWAEIHNSHLAKHGYEVWIDHRSFEAMGIDAVPTTHRGPAADNIDERGEMSERMETAQEAARANYRKYAADPSLVLKKITIQKAVFTRHDIAREINRTECSAQEFRALYYRVGACDELVAVEAPGFDPFTGEESSEALLSTRTVVQLEHEMLLDIEALKDASFQSLSDKHLAAAYERFEKERGFALNDEQKNVVRHLTRDNACAVVVGYAGAGKSTTMDALRVAFDRKQVRVIGGALAGIASDNLREEAGIASRTLASWEYQWSQGRMLPDSDTVFVMDEAGMVSSDQMGRITRVLRERGAKMIVLGDARQLQPIRAGAAFRAFADVAGYVELNNVVRQTEDWMRDASIRFGRGEYEAAVDAYLSRDRVTWAGDEQKAMSQLIDDWAGYHRAGADVVIMAHRNKDVIALNHQARAALKADGALQDETSFGTARGERMFAEGDTVLFLQNERSLDVFNGSVGTVTEVARNRLTVLVEGHGEPVVVRANEYNQIDYGYARTIHKEQGCTVDRSFVYASPTMDAQLSYVALTRHREDVQVYAARTVFKDDRRLKQVMSRDRLKDTTVLHRGTEDYQDTIRGFAERRGFPTTESIREFVAANVQNMRERFNRVSAAFTRIRAPRRFDPGQSRDARVTSRPVPDRAQAVQSNPVRIPEVSEGLAHSLNRLAHNAKPIVVGAVRRRGFVRSADYELHLAGSGPKLQSFNETIRGVLPASQIIAQGLERPDTDDALLQPLSDDWKDFMVENWPQVFAAQRAERDHAMIEELKERVAGQKIENWYESHLQQTRERFVPEKPLIPAAEIDPVPTAAEVRAAVFDDPNMRQTRAVARDVIAQVYGANCRALETISRRYLDTGDKASILADVKANPEMFGDVRGSVRLGFANAERKEALSHIGTLEYVVGNYLDQAERLAPRIEARIVEHRSVLREPVADLSPAAERFVQRAARIGRMDAGPDKYTALDSLLEDKASVKELQRLQDALTARYGLGERAFARGMKDDDGLRNLPAVDRSRIQEKAVLVMGSWTSIVGTVQDRRRIEQNLERGKDQYKGYER
ncbi:Ti-type conjugative transfer relaxase TraA [Nitratireductor sp. XY-223]|uniref:Ti-type conjugative transfer relaxase TraA n=1 Tax=Nitratireductor sp. XY-223 TaxID=2561926 RepID=UPI00145BE942|nr:Ti-type conjugative transfer relaxase TraA [Nitratireductor sp. XY-223]